MRIFTAVRHSNDPRFYYGGLWSANFYPALRQLGHEVVESQVDLLPGSRFMHIASDFSQEARQERERATHQIVAEVKGAHAAGGLDLFLAYFYNSHFDPSGFEEIRRLGIPTINFYCNSIYQFELVNEIAPRVDYAWHTERDARSLYLKAGAQPVCVQMGADPDVYRPVARAARQSKACFVGQKYADRDRWVAALIRANVPVDVYGHGWGMNGSTPNGGVKPQAGEQYAKGQASPGSFSSYLQAVGQNLRTHGMFKGTSRTCRQFQYLRQTRKLSPLLSNVARGESSNLCETLADYQVVLNFSNVWADGRPGSKLIPHVRLRDFEAPMARACYLTGHTEEIAEFYELKKEIDTYQSTEELVDKTRFYLSHPAEAERLREAGYRRARRDHTWTRRFEKLFTQIGLAAKGQ